MKCPHCGKELILNEVCYRNVEIYHNNAIARANCCGKLINLKLVISFNVTKYTGNAKEDDWGYPAK